jgi:CRP-like cAMP-binding protein
MQLLDWLVTIFPGIESLDSALFGQLVAISRVIEVAADTIFCRQGVAPELVHWLLHGQVTLSQAGPHGDPAIIDIVEPIAGITLASAILGQTCPITAQTLTKSAIIAIEAAPLRALTAAHPALAGTFLRAASVDIVSANRQIVDLKVRKIAQRLGCYLLSLADDLDTHPVDIRLPFRKSLLAGKLGCGQESLSRAFASLRELGVETRGYNVNLHNVPLLRAFSAADGPAPWKRASAADAFSRAFDL